MYPMIETTVRVEVQHDNSVHPGVCSDGCSSQQCKVLLIGWVITMELLQIVNYALNTSLLVIATITNVALKCKTLTHSVNSYKQKP